MTPRDARNIAEVVSALSKAKGKALRELMAELAEDDRAGVQAAVLQAKAREDARKAEASRLKQLYALESSLREEGYAVVAGIDEVGRGALAGPLTAGACVLPIRPHLIGLNDSKQLTPQRREELDAEIRSTALCCAVGHVSAEELDQMGMTAALRRAIGRALSGLVMSPDHVIVDGHPLRVHENETAVIKGDAKVAGVAAASIIAKVARDAIMVGLGAEYPEYGFEINKGYGTPEHLAAIANAGLSPVHRLSFSIGGGTGTLF